jgi:hypothetical protein
MNTIIIEDNHRIGEIESDIESATDTDTDTDNSDDTIEPNENENEIVRSYVNNGTNTERELGGNCMVCYTVLDIFNIVNMECGHKMCSKCFPRWMTTNASCPSCRYKLSTRIQLTNEEYHREISDINSKYLFTADRFFRRHKEYVNLKRTTDALMKRQISLYEQLEYTEGVLIGASMAIEEIDMELSEKEKRMSRPLITFKKEMKKIPWMNGYNDGYTRGVELIHKQQDMVYDVLDITRGNNLFDYGFTKDKLKKGEVDLEYGEKYRNKHKEKTNKKVKRSCKRNRSNTSEEEKEEEINYDLVDEEVV